MLNILIFNSENTTADSPNPAYLICICLIRETDLQHLCCFLYLSSPYNAAWIHRRPLWDFMFLSDVYEGMPVLMPSGGCRRNLPRRCTSWHHDSLLSPCVPFSIWYNLVFCSWTDANCKSMGKWRRLLIPCCYRQLKPHTPSSSPVPRHLAKPPLWLLLFSSHHKNSLFCQPISNWIF